MRISQIKTLCWAGNVLVLAGAAYVGLHFWETYQARGAKVEVKWPAETGPEAIEKRWPGEVSAFQDIWKTPVNGLVPPPPEKIEGPKPKDDPERDFRAKYQCSAVLFVLGSSVDSVAYIKGGGTGDRTLRTGETIDRFTLIGFERNPENGAPVLVFTHPKLDHLVRVERMTPAVPNVFDGKPFELLAENELVKPTVTRTEIPRRAYQDLIEDPSGLTWVVPSDEVDWWEQFGESEVFSKLVVNVAEDAQGRPRGIRLMSDPGQGTPVATGRGLNQGDIIVSINDVPVRGKEDVLTYLRGDGQGLTRYRVLIESEGGLQRTVVYKVDRQGRPRVSR